MYPQEKIKKFKFKCIKPFVAEMIVLIFVAATVTVGLLTGKFIEITVKPHFISIAFLVIVIGLFPALFSRVVNLGIKATLDFVFQNTKTDNYEFVEELPYHASVFSEKFGSNAERSYGMYYLIQVKKDDKIFTFISPSYIDFETGKRYVVRTAASSHIVLDWSEDKETKDTTGKKGGNN